MSKLNLDLSDLSVTSFTTSQRGPEDGTVRGQIDSYDGCDPYTNGHTCEVTCEFVCDTCDNTCDDAATCDVFGCGTEGLRCFTPE